MLVLNKKSFSDRNGVSENDYIKISLSPENTLVPDLYNKLPGKSVWVPANKELFTGILKREELKAHFKLPELSTSGLGYLIENNLRKKILNSISLTKKAGNLVIGLDAIKTQISQKKHILILAAKGAKSLKNYSFFFSNHISIFEGFLKQQDLEKSTGKNNVKYIGILSKSFKKTIQVDLNKLKGFIENH